MGLSLPRPTAAQRNARVSLQAGYGDYVGQIPVLYEFLTFSSICSEGPYLVLGGELKEKGKAYNADDLK